MKEFIKSIIKRLPIAFTRNQRYDLLTKKILKKYLQPTSNCIDVGAHKGEFTLDFLKYAPKGQHFAFEPIPGFYKNLVTKFANHTVKVLPFALSNEKGQATFNYVVSNPSYSGLQKRQYDRPSEEDTKITVEKELIDNIIPSDLKIDFIKIDVEGGEYHVLQGGKKLIKKHRPKIVFEFGKGAADVYGTSPSEMYQLLEELGLEIFLLENLLGGKPALTLAEFEQQYNNNLNYYFIAA